MIRALHAFGLIAAIFASQVQAAELVLPQGKNAFYADEAIELAVAGLGLNATATVEVLPQGDGGLGTIECPVRGDGSTVTVVLPPMTSRPASMPSHSTAGRRRRAFVVSSGRERLDHADHADHERGRT